MPDDSDRLVVCDLDGVMRLLSAIVRPCKVTGEYVFRALQELKTDDSSRGRLGVARFDRSPRKSIDILACGGRFRFHGAALLGHAIPRIRHIAIKASRMQ